MGTITRLSEATSRCAKAANLANEPDRITRLADYAMETPEIRKRVISVLEEYEQNCGDLRSAAAAHRAISTILGVSMLEALREEIQ